ncbi:MAG: hypothetical protein HYY34_05015 [Chloroflexi bacterium]|nr:hypothetical protein [Chloroflexota bacterium]
MVSFEEFARRASELGFGTTAEDFRLIENRLKSLQTVLDVVRGVDVLGFEPASTFAPPPDSTPPVGRPPRAIRQPSGW